MKSFLKWFAITFLAAAWIPAFAANVQGMNFPKHLGTFTLNSVVNDEKEIPGQGTALLYEAPGVKASVFVYDLGMKHIESGIDSKAVRDEFLKTSGDVRTVHPDAQNLDSSKNLTVSGIPLLHVAFQYVESEPGSRDIVFSNLYITAKNGNFILIRTTYSAINQPQRGYRVEMGFIESLCKALSAAGSR